MDRARKTRRLPRNFEQSGSRVEDPDRAARSRQRPDEARPSRPRRRPGQKPRPAERKLHAHERPPAEPLPERPDHPPRADSDWRPSDVPEQKTPTVAGFSLSAAILAIPINGARFLVNVGLHAVYAVTCRIRKVLQQPLPD